MSRSFVGFHLWHHWYTVSDDRAATGRRRPSMLARVLEACTDCTAERTRRVPWPKVDRRA